MALNTALIIDGRLALKFFRVLTAPSEINHALLKRQPELFINSTGPEERSLSAIFVFHLSL